jgi:hypothetical protein
MLSVGSAALGSLALEVWVASAPNPRLETKLHAGTMLRACPSNNAKSQKAAIGGEWNAIIPVM